MDNIKDNLPKYLSGYSDVPNERTLEAQWCIDSETGRKYLIDLRTGKIIGEWLKNDCG